MKERGTVAGYKKQRQCAKNDMKEKSEKLALEDAMNVSNQLRSKKTKRKTKSLMHKNERGNE